MYIPSWVLSAIVLLSPGKQKRYFNDLYAGKKCMVSGKVEGTKYEEPTSSLSLSGRRAGWCPCWVSPETGEYPS